MCQSAPRHPALPRMRFSCWVTKTTDTKSEYVIRRAFHQRKWCREHAPALRLYVHCLSCICSFTGMKRINSISYTVLLCLGSQSAFAAKRYLCCQQPLFLLSTFLFSSNVKRTKSLIWMELSTWPRQFYASSRPYPVENISPENVVPLEQQARSSLWHPLST